MNMTMDILRTSRVFSYLGQQFLMGNVDVLKYFYGHIWRESPPLIRTISQLQDCLTSVEIESDTYGTYNKEFLYYWGMICLGEQSSLIIRNLSTANTCFQKVKASIPQAEARLAYIGLLQSTDPTKDDRNVARIDTLRRWACKQDMFSMIVLAKISLYRFLEEGHLDDSELPHQAIRLLELPCSLGHPVAIRLWNQIFTLTGNPDGLISEVRINEGSLYDLKTPANIQIGP